MGWHNRYHAGRVNNIILTLCNLLESICFLVTFMVVFLLYWWVFDSATMPANPRSATQGESDRSLGKVRIACIVFTYEQRHQPVLGHTMHTWTRHCDRVLCVSNAPNDNFEPVIFKEQATKRGLSYLYRYYFDDADWFLCAEDSTFVIVENLRYLLRSYSPEEPIFFGCKFKTHQHLTYMYSGAGYVLSKEALRRYVTMALPNGTICPNGDSGSEDEQISECLQNVGVIAGDSRDAKGRQTFIPFSPAEAVGTVSEERQAWYKNRSYYDHGNFTKEMLSPHAISFKAANVLHMRDMYFFIYKLRKFGQKRSSEVMPIPSPLS